jgi:hypothetical protein
MKSATLLVAVLFLAALAGDDAAAAPKATASLQSTVNNRQSAIANGADAITIPQMLSYQGKLTDTLDVPVPNSSYPIVFLLYTAPSGGSPFWSESQSVTTKNGLFSVLLGSDTPIGSIPDAGAVYLTMTVSGGAELTPRLRIASAAYSYLAARSANADLLQGKDTTALDSRYVNEGQASSVTSNMMVDGTIAAVDLGQMGASSGQVMKWTGSAWAPRNDSVGSSSGGTVTSVSQATGVICTPNPITTTGTVGFDQTYGDGRYIKNQFSTNQSASWRVTGQGRCTTATNGGAALYGIHTASGWGVRGDGTSYPGVTAVSTTTNYGAVEGINDASSATGSCSGVAGFGNAGCGVWGTSSSNYGVYGRSTSSHGVAGVSTNSYGAYDSSNSSYGAYCVGSAGGVYGKSANGYGVRATSTSNCGVYGNSSSDCGVYGSSASAWGVYGEAAADGYAGVYGRSTVTGTGTGIGVRGNSPTYWGAQGYRAFSQKGSGYGSSGTRGGLWGYTLWGDTWTFGTAGYTWGDYRRTGGVIGADGDANTWGSLGYKNSSGNWYAGYGTAAWNTGSGLSSHPASGIGCGYGGGLMGGWLKGTYYGATVSGDRYALYTKGNNYTTGYSAVMHNTGGKREASYVPTSTTVDIYTSGVSEMKGGQANVSFPASFASMVSKDVPIVVTATPMGPAPIYLSSSDDKGFAVAAVDAKASVKFSWIAVGRRAGYEKNPEVPAELCRTDFDSKMDGVMSDENDLKHPAQPVWFDGTQLRFDNPPEEPRPPKPAQPVEVGLHAPPPEPVPVTPARSFTPSTAPIPSTTTVPVPRPSETQGTGAGR